MGYEDKGIFYLELLNIPNRKGIYTMDDGYKIYDKFGYIVYVFVDKTHTHSILITRKCGVFSKIEL